MKYTLKESMDFITLRCKELKSHADNNQRNKTSFVYNQQNVNCYCLTER